MAIGTVVTVILFARQFSDPLENIAFGLGYIQHVKGAAKRVFAILDLPEEPDPDGKTESAARGRVEIKHVDFSYDPVGYRDALNIIHENWDAIPITQNYILQLHRFLYSQTGNPLAGRTKNVQNYISAAYPDGHTEIIFTPLAPYETPEALDRICEEYNRVIGNMELEPLITIPVFIHDFLCIHPFNDGNGRMSRLLTTLLLYRSGFCIGKYISLEAKIAKNKDAYYNALKASQDGWDEGHDDPLPFIKYLLGIILATYRDFEDRFSLVETRRSALETVRLAAGNKIGRFTKQDIRELCPALSISSVEGALRKLVEAGELKREGGGKNTFYFHLN